MIVLIPMAGAGSRFKNAGYKDPKPLIDVAGKAMIERVVENIGYPDAHYVFIAQKKHLEDYPAIKSKLKESARKVSIVEIEELTEGAACTTLLAKELINTEERLLICNADQWVDWLPAHFFEYAKKYDGVIPYFVSDSPKHSYSKINFYSGLIEQVAEKQVISNFATVGMYYWKHGSEYVRCAERMINKNIRFNNEFYICPVYNELIHHCNGKVSPYPVFEMRGMGTPEELNKFLEKLK
jgi:NDP-sugar pyrophosphorylase family protein